MLDDIKPVSGRKGGKGGGSSRTPYEAPDNLLTDSTAYLIDVVSEGEIEGWADADNPGTCIYFDDTPLQNADGSFNFEGVEYWLRTGTPDQEPVPGFSAVENEVGVSVLVEQQQPVVRSVTAADVDAVRIKVGVASLSNLNTVNGDLTEASVKFAIEMQAGAGSWEAVGNYAISGKTTSGYQRAYRVELPDVRPVSIRVRRTTPDTESSNIQDDLYFVSYTEIIDAKLRYPDTAYVALAVPASAFGGRVPRRSYRLKGVKCWVPSNYDPVARTYDETTIWDGTFQQAFTSNPAFLTYTVLLEDRWGLGERISPDLVDKWRFYQIGKYCDELVPDGLGGMEPRFTMNGVMNTREAAYQVITQLSAAFRGVTYWGAGAVVPVQDAPADPVKIVTNANVVDGAFNYAGTGLSARKTAVVTSYRHADDHFKVKAGLVFEDHDAIQRYGRRQVDTTLPFTTSRGEALRTAKWIVDTNLTSRDAVNYQAGFDHAAIRPGDKLLISDKHRIGFRVGGRIVAVAGDRLTVTIDAPVSIEAGESYQILIATDVGEYLTVDVDAASGDAITEIGLVSALPATVMPGAVFVLSATDMAPRLYRVVSNTPEKHLFNIVALEDDAEKYNRVELGINVADDAPYILPSTRSLAPPSGLTLRPFVRPDPGSKSKLRLLASWSSSDNPLVFKYLVRLKEPNGVWRDVGETTETSLEMTPDRDDVGSYEVRVHAITVLGEVSSYSLVSAENSDVFPRPAMPTGWQGDPGNDNVTLWGNAHPAPDFKAFVIYGATADDATLLRLDEITTTRYVRRVHANDTITRYAVTAINHNGDESFPTDFITVSPAPPRIEDLHIEVGEAIEAAQAAADGAASSARQALQDAANVRAEHDALVEGFPEGGTIEGAIEDLRAENEAHLAPLGTPVLREPRSLWSRDVRMPWPDLMKPAVTTGLFVTDDADFGDCFEFEENDNSAIGPAYPVEFDPNRVYRITARYKVVDDGDGAGVRMRLGVSTQTGTTIVQSNIQAGDLHSPWLLAADGPQTSVRYVSGDEAALDAYGIAGSDRIVLTGSDSANKLYPHFRENSGGSTSGRVRLASLEVVDVTEVLAGVNALRTELQSNIDGVSTTLTDDYYTAASTDQAISAAQTTLQSNIDGVASNLSTNYLTRTQTDSAISAVQTTLEAKIEEQAQELVQDGFFEDPTLDGWSFDSADYIGQRINPATTSPASDFALRVERVTSGSTGYFRYRSKSGRFNVVGKTLRFTGWIRPSGTVNWVQLGFRMVRSDGSYYSFRLSDQFVPSSGWNRFAVDITIPDSLTDAAYASQLTGRIDADAGANVDITDLSCKEVTDLAAVEGDVTSIKALTLDNSTAFGVLMNQLAVSAGGTSATITDHVSAKADLDGFASAYAGVTVDTNGGNIAGFRATSFANPDGSGNGVLELLGDVVAEGTLAANRLTVGLGKNLLSNSDFSDGLFGWRVRTRSGAAGSDSNVALRPSGDPWAGTFYPTLMIEQTSAAAAGYIKVINNYYIDDLPAPGIPISAGEWVEASVQFSAVRCTLGLALLFLDKTGALISGETSLGSETDQEGQNDDPETWPVLWGKAQAPAATAFVQLQFRKSGTNDPAFDSSFLFLHKPQVAISHEAATLPSPYGPGGTTRISGAKIMTGAITAESAILAEASVIEANIQDLSVSTLKIRDQAVTIPVSVQDETYHTVSSTTEWTDIVSATIDREGIATRIQFSCQLDGQNGTVGDVAIARFRLVRDGTVVAGEYHMTTAPRGRQVSVTFSTTDSDTGTGMSTYTVQLRKKLTGVDDSRDPRAFKKYLLLQQFKK